MFKRLTKNDTRRLIKALADVHLWSNEPGEFAAAKARNASDVLAEYGVSYSLSYREYLLTEKYFRMMMMYHSNVVQAVNKLIQAGKYEIQ